MRRDARARKELKAVIASLDKTYDLVFVNYDDSFSDDQLTRYLEEGIEGLDASMEDWQSECQFDGAMYVIGELGLPDDQRELFDEFDLMDELRFEIYDRDSSTPFSDLAGHTGKKMWRYHVQCELEDHEDWCGQDDLQTIANALGISMRSNQLVLRELISEAGYGSLNVIWYGEFDQFIKADANAGGSGADTIRWTDPHILCYDGGQGAGHDVQIRGTVSLPFALDNVRLDAGRGSWSDDIAGVVKSCYDTKWELFKLDPEILRAGLIDVRAQLRCR